jgi:hypothetical protein
MKTYMFADAETGVFSGASYTGPEHWLAANTPAGHVVVEGTHDHRRVRLDVDKGDLVSYLPPAPPADDMRTWTWDAEAWAWVPVPTDKAVADAVRHKRAVLLAATDWTQLPDVMSARAAQWADYRQALRDVTSQPGFPHEITWPTEPTP